MCGIDPLTGEDRIFAHPRTLDSPIGTASMPGTFSQWQVYDRLSCVKVDKDVPLAVACLVACGVQTGGGVGNAGGQRASRRRRHRGGCRRSGHERVQGAALRGACHVIAVDPVAQKHKWALDFGATEAYDSLTAAAPRLADLTNGPGADVVIMTPGVLHNELVGEGYQAVRKAGTWSSRRWDPVPRRG